MSLVKKGDTVVYRDARGEDAGAQVVVSVPTLVDASGAPFRPDAMAQTLAYTGDSLTSISATDGTNTWVQTLSYTNGKLTGISAWVKQ